MKLTPVGANMTEIEFKNKNLDGRLLFSYKTPVAFIGFNVDGMAIAYKTEKRWSATTSRHITKWAGIHGFNSDAMGTIEQSWFDGLI